MKRTTTATELPGGIWLGLECGHPTPSRNQDRAEFDCQRCDRRQMPRTTRPGRRTPVFTFDTIPPALRALHQTTAWAELVVLRGQVDFFDDDPHWHATATPIRRVVIVPKRRHHIVPGSDAEFYVQFYDLHARSESRHLEPAS